MPYTESCFKHSLEPDAFRHVTLARPKDGHRWGMGRVGVVLGVHPMEMLG